MITRTALSLLVAPALLTITVAGSAQAQSSGGDRSPAGGAFMSSYGTNPYPTARAYPGRGDPGASGVPVRRYGRARSRR